MHITLGPALRTKTMADIHVLPIADLREHEESIACWCVPMLQQVEDSTSYVVVHHAADGRELVEEHGIN